MSVDHEKALNEFVEKLSINKRTIAEEMLKWIDLLQKYLEFRENLIIVKHQENLSR